MLPRLLCLLPLLFVCSFTALAQAFEPALLVRANGDTLRGEIENGFWEEPPVFIRFRSTASSPSELFKPRQLRAVSFTNGRYFRYEALPIDHAAETRSNRLARGYRPLIRTDSLLAEVLVQGSVSLLRVVTPGSVHFLLQSSTQPVLDLSERRYLSQTTDGTWAVTNANNYRSQLAVYFGTCPAAASAAQKAAFNAEGLGAVVQAYNEQCDPAHQTGRSWLAVAKPRRVVSMQGGVLGGIRNTHLSYESDDNNSPTCHDCKLRPFVGVYADLLQPGRNLVLHGELSLSSFRSLTNGEAWLGTARLGGRYFWPLPREQQVFLGMSFELNSQWRAGAQAKGFTGPFAGEYAIPVALPGLNAGWRRQRLTLSFDGQMYGSKPINDTTLGDLLGRVVGSNFVLRTTVAYRLGRNPDVAKPPAPVRP